VHRRLLIDFLRWSERCSDRYVVCRCYDTAAVTVVEVVFSVIVVPLCVIVTVIYLDVCPIDTKELAERDLLGKLVN
jgi:hypothetical protein